MKVTVGDSGLSCCAWVTILSSPFMSQVTIPAAFLLFLFVCLFVVALLTCSAGQKTGGNFYRDKVEFVATMSGFVESNLHPVTATVSQ